MGYGRRLEEILSGWVEKKYIPLLEEKEMLEDKLARALSDRERYRKQAQRLNDKIKILRKDD